MNTGTGWGKQIFGPGTQLKVIGSKSSLVIRICNSCPFGKAFKTTI